MVFLVDDLKSADISGGRQTAQLKVRRRSIERKGFRNRGRLDQGKVKAFIKTKRKSSTEIDKLIAEVSACACKHAQKEGQ